VELVVVDDEGNPDVAGQRALVLVRRQEPSAALLGACAPAVTLVRVAEARQVPLVSACGPLPQPDSPVPVASTWQLGPSPDAHAAAVAAALGPPGSGPVALVVSPGRSPAAWASALAAAGQPLAGTWTRGPGGRAGWEVTAAQVRASGATRVLAVTDPPDGLLLWQAVVQQGWQPRAAYVRDAGLSTSWIRAVGEAGEGVVTDRGRRRRQHARAGGRAGVGRGDRRAAGRAVAGRLRAPQRHRGGPGGRTRRPAGHAGRRARRPSWGPGATARWSRYRADARTWSANQR
jgi:ABC-type branched-subunit amino acid transport system substrate-binding protein